MTESVKRRELSERLFSAYKQAILWWLAFWGYAIIAVIVAVIGFFLGGAGYFQGATRGVVEFFGVILLIIGVILLITSGFSAVIFAASRGGVIENTVGFIEAYKITFKLVAELAVAVIAAIILILLGDLISGPFGGLLGFIGGLAFSLFPIAGMFYIINYLIARK